MRRFAAQLVLLLVWCIGFQPFAQAMGVHGMQVGNSMPTAEQAAINGIHAPHQMHSAPDMSGQKCHMEQAAAKKTAAQPSSDSCPCDGHCVMPGCVGAVAAITPMPVTRSFDRFTDSYSALEVPAQPLAAHGLDLIRPPSKS